jgi:hypothetical protein
VTLLLRPATWRAPAPRWRRNPPVSASFARASSCAPVGACLWQWLRNVMAMGRTPIIEVIDPDGVWDTSEAVWIDRLIAAGHPLTNVLSLVPEPRLAFGEVLWSE